MESEAVGVVGEVTIHDFLIDSGDDFLQADFLW